MSATNGSASTHYDPQQSLFDLQSPSLGNSSARVISDDQVITTSAGFAAPIINRGSRRLAAGGLGRTRSLRRVASEADLSEASGGLQSLESAPLTVDAARAMERSRDFTFAGGISPPPLASPPGYTSPISGSFGTAMSNLGSNYETALGVSTATTYATPTAGTARSSAQSIRTAFQSTPMGTAREGHNSPSMKIAQAETPATTARPLSSAASMHTALTTTAQGTPGQWSTDPDMSTPPASTAVITAPLFSPSERTAVPTFSVTGPSPGSSTTTAIPGRERDAPRSSSQYYTARESAFSTTSGGLMSPFETAEERASRMSTSTYDTAPPPVPSRDSRYGTASLAPTSPVSSRASSQVRYQLHDAPVPSVYSTATQPSETTIWVTAASQNKSYATARAPTTQYDSASTSVYQTAQPKSISEYSTAPPPPISRSITPSEMLSWRSYDRDDAVTHVSEESDLALIADLERQSSSGSEAFGRDRQVTIVHAQPSVYATAQEWSTYSSGQPYATATEGTVYQTAHETNYATAPSWSTQSTYMTTARGTQE